MPYARFAAEKEKTNVVFYESGKLVVQGKGTQEFVEFVLEPEILKEARLGYEAVLNPDLLLPRLGVDESGKGDFFGPLCIAGVYVNEAVVKAWKDAGIRDSKNISSDKRITRAGGADPRDARLRDDGGADRQRGLQPALRQDAERQHHAGLGPRAGDREPDGPATSDEPAAGAGHQRPVRLEQGHRGQGADDPGPRDRAGAEAQAEEDLAVAAASILARHEFVTRLAELEKQFGIELPKGASAAVDAAAKEFIAKHGVGKLAKVAKMHFRTALRAQGLPEPPKSEWRRPNSASEGQAGE